MKEAPVHARARRLGRQSRGVVLSGNLDSLAYEARSAIARTRSLAAMCGLQIGKGSTPSGICLSRMRRKAAFGKSASSNSAVSKNCRHSCEPTKRIVLASMEAAAKTFDPHKSSVKKGSARSFSGGLKKYNLGQLLEAAWQFPKIKVSHT